MSHKLIPANSIHFQDGYNSIVRSRSEFAQNVKDVEKSMEAQGDNPELFPIKYVTLGKEKFTRNHATLQAALNRGWKEVYAMPSPHEANSVADLLDLVHSNNGGHPLSRVSQGKLYAKLAEGELDEEAMAKALKDAKPGEEVPQIWKREPMSLDQIASACKPAYSSEHIRQCKLLAEVTPEIGALLESDQVSSRVVIKAIALAKDDDTKALRIIRAAIRNAKEDGKETATEKHFDAIKAEFQPVRKLVADGKTTKEAPASAQNGTQEPPKDEKEDDTPPTLPTGNSEEPASELFTKSESQSPVKAKDAKKALLTIIAKWCEDTANVYEDSEMEDLATRIIEANLPL